MKISRFQTCLLAALLSSTFIPTVGAASERESAPVGVMESIRKFLGIQPRRVSVGGTRSPGTPTPSVCLLAPGPITEVDGKSKVLVVQPKPDLVVGSPLSELQIRSADRVVWAKVATTEGPIPERISWPIAAITPNQSLILALRPWNADLGDWALVELVGAAADEMERATQIIQKSTDSQSRTAAINQAIERGDGPTAFALIWSESANVGSQIGGLRKADADGC